MAARNVLPTRAPDPEPAPQDVDLREVVSRMRAKQMHRKAVAAGTQERPAKAPAEEVTSTGLDRSLPAGDREE